MQSVIGEALHLDIQRLAAAIDDLANQIKEGRELMAEMFQSLRADIEGLSTKVGEKASRADIESLSAKLNEKASKTDIDGASRSLKSDIDAINKKLDILLVNRAKKPQPG